MPYIECVRVELAASPALETLLRLLSFKTERVQELAAKVLAACAVPDAVVAGWKRVGLKEVVAVLTSKETSPKVQAVLCGAPSRARFVCATSRR